MKVEIPLEKDETYRILTPTVKSEDGKLLLKQQSYSITIDSQLASRLKNAKKIKLVVIE